MKNVSSLSKNKQESHGTKQGAFLLNIKGFHMAETLKTKLARFFHKRPPV
jgi:hypothetical protein